MGTIASDEAATGSVEVGYHSTFVSPASLPQQPESATPTGKTSERKPAQSSAEPNRLDATIQQLSWQLLKNSNSKSELPDKARQFANSWCGVVNADQVVVICKGKNGKARVRAVSGAPSFDASSASIQQIEQIAGSMGDSKAPLDWSVSGSSDGEDTMMGTYCRLNGFQSGMLIPMFTYDSTLVGHIATFKTNGAVDRKKLEVLSNELFPVLAQNFSFSLKVERGRVGQFVRNTWKYLIVGKKVFWMVMLTLFTAFMLLPIPYEVTCDSTLEPTYRRYIASPFEGKLKESLVEPGNSVEKDQILAVLDGDNFRLELAAAKAEHEREKERHSAALQEGRVSDAQIAKLEMQKLKHDIERLNQKIANLEIKSPIDGMIVSGDLEHSEGAPLEQGQTLFEVGPIDELDIEIEIPESEIRFIEKKQTVTVRFHAFPLKEFTGTIDSIYPRAETREDKVVFVARARIQNDEGLLRPGMEGNASILVGDSVLGWNLFHHPVDRLRSYLGW